MSRTIEERLAAIEQEVSDLKLRELSDLKEKVNGIDKRTWAILVVLLSLTIGLLARGL